MRIPFGKPFPAIDSTSLRNGVAAGLVNGYINELDDYQIVPGHTLFSTVMADVVGNGIARHFDGTPTVDYLLLPTSSETYTAMTLYGWFTLEDSGQRRAMAGRLYDYHNGWAWFVDQSNLLTFFSTGDPVDDPEQFSSVTCPDLSQWRFLAVTYDSAAVSDQVKFYASDAEGPASSIALIGTATKTTLGFAELSIYGIKIGACLYGDLLTGGALTGWKGGIDQFGIATVALTLEQLQAMAYGGSLPDLTDIKEILEITGEEPEPATATGGTPDEFEVHGTTVMTGSVGSYFADGSPPPVTVSASVDALYETLSGVVLAVLNGTVHKIDSSGFSTAFTGDVLTSGTFCYFAEDGQNVFIAHGGKLARLDMRALTVTLLNQNTPSDVTHLCRSKGFLLCNGNDVPITSSVFDLAQVFDNSSSLYSVVVLHDQPGWIVAAGQGTFTVDDDDGRLYLSKDNGINWMRIFSTADNNQFQALEYMGNGIVLAGTAFSEGHIFISINYGVNWTDLGQMGTATNINFIKKLTDTIVIAGTGSSPSEAPVAGRAKLWRSVDSGATWADIGIDFGREVSAAEAISDNGSIVAVATVSFIDEVRVWRSSDYAETFFPISSPDPFSGGFPDAGYVPFIQRYDNQTAIMSNGFVTGTQKIWRTVDQGDNWVEIGPIPDFPENAMPWCACQMADGSLLIGTAGDNLGLGGAQLWKSVDGGLTWFLLTILEEFQTAAVQWGGLKETHVAGTIIATGRIAEGRDGTATAAKWQTAIGRNTPQGDVFYSEDISNEYEAVDSWERFNAQAVPDGCTGVFENRALVYSGGPRSIEINFNSPDPEFPWQVSDPSLPYGLGGPNSWVNFEDLNTVMYLSCTDNIWEVVRFQGRVQQSISQVYSAILNDRTMIGSPETAKAWGIVMRGIPMYCITFQDDSLTICYNLVKDHWFRWAYWDGANYSAALINAYCYSKSMKKHLVGDRRATGKIFELDGTADDSGDMRFELTSGHVGNWEPTVAGRMMFKCKRGAVTDASEPSFVWQNRDNGNTNFSTGRTVSLGATTDTEFFGALNRNGVYQVRQHRIVYEGQHTDFIFAGADES